MADIDVAEPWPELDRTDFRPYLARVDAASLQRNMYLIKSVRAVPSFFLSCSKRTAEQPQESYTVLVRSVLLPLN